MRASRSSLATVIASVSQRLNKLGAVIERHHPHALRFAARVGEDLVGLLLGARHDSRLLDELVGLMLRVGNERIGLTLRVGNELVGALRRLGDGRLRALFAFHAQLLRLRLGLSRHVFVVLFRIAENAAFLPHNPVAVLDRLGHAVAHHLHQPQHGRAVDDALVRQRHALGFFQTALQLGNHFKNIVTRFHRNSPLYFRPAGQSHASASSRAASGTMPARLPPKRATSRAMLDEMATVSGEEAINSVSTPES